MVEQFIKKPVLFLWLEEANFHWVVCYGFNMYNEYLVWISSKLNVKDISMSNTNELYEKRSTSTSIDRATMMEGTKKH